jgi:hypothetical protein
VVGDGEQVAPVAGDGVAEGAAPDAHDLLYDKKLTYLLTLTHFFLLTGKKIPYEINGTYRTVN